MPNLPAIDLLDMTISVESNVFHQGEDEDGYPQEHLAYFVVATFASGRRFAHVHAFTTVGSSARVADAKAMALSARVDVARLTGAWDGPVANDRWNEMYPVYGSEYYQEGGRGDVEMRQWERDQESSTL